MVTKKGSEKYYIIISLILGLIVLGLSLFFIFNEYFTQDELDWQQCRQSIILRAGLPEADLAALKTDTKGAFPLKCRTEVVEIDSLESPEDVYEIISNAVAEGWYMFGEGKLDFVHRSVFLDETLCMVFARVHFSQEAVDDFDNENVYSWIDYFVDKYGSDVNILTPPQIRQRGFRDYYRFTEAGSSGETYDKYLPIYSGGIPSDDGNLMVDLDNVRFSPEENKDYLLVYRINKVNGIVSGTIGGFLSKFIPEAVSSFVWTDQSVKSWEELKTIALTSMDGLDKIGCDKFLTIPA